MFTPAEEELLKLIRPAKLRGSVDPDGNPDDDRRIVLGKVEELVGRIRSDRNSKKIERAFSSSRRNSLKL